MTKERLTNRKFSEESRGNRQWIPLRVSPVVGEQKNEIKRQKRNKRWRRVIATRSPRDSSEEEKRGVGMVYLNVNTEFLFLFSKHKVKMTKRSNGS